MNGGLWFESPLSNWFAEKGIYHADDMSSIILTSWHRRFKGENIRLDEQIEHYQNWWKEQGATMEQMAETRRKTIEEYKRKYGDN